MDPLRFVKTIKEHCRMCYTCVRECPAKAIRIAEGQAEVISERCIGCGNCIRVCSQRAKEVADSKVAVAAMLAEGRAARGAGGTGFQPVADPGWKPGPPAVAAMLAPSFPAEFTDCSWRHLVGMLRALGFDLVTEVAFGADLVAAAYRRLLDGTDTGHPGGQRAAGARYIASTCPAIVAFVERYHPDLVGQLAPIVSPMVATARALRQLHGPQLKTVFIGPCIAKKGEAWHRFPTCGAGPQVENLCYQVDAALTFVELRELLAEAGIRAAGAAGGRGPQSRSEPLSRPSPRGEGVAIGDPSQESDFDPPHPATGALFSVSRGLLQAADIREDLLDDRVVTADGRHSFVQALEEFASGQTALEGSLDGKEGSGEIKGPRLLEVLACRGCIMGPAFSGGLPQSGASEGRYEGSAEGSFARRSRISSYVRDKLSRLDRKQWQGWMDRFADLDLSRTFTAYDQRMNVPFEEEVRQIMVKLGKMELSDELNCGACGYETCREHAVAIFKGLAEAEMCLPHMIDKLHLTVEELGRSNAQLASAREALVQSEKLASMGQLAAGIAHEVNNPLGVVLMYSHLLLEEHAASQGSAKAKNEGGQPADWGPTLREDLAMIAEQADRCKRIVAGLLNFARQSQLDRQPTDVRELVDRTVKVLSRPENVEVVVEHGLGDPLAELDADQIAQVLNNLFSNALAAMAPGAAGGGRLTVTTLGDARSVCMRVADSGVGIPPANLPRIFEPFFTTKQIGKGTGLGLAVTYGVIKMHGGSIDVQSNADPAKGPTGSTFSVTLPRESVSKEAIS